MATTNDNIFCVYTHYNKETNNIIYVGKGLKYRPYSKTNRNLLWERIVRKYDYYVKIVESNLTNDEACKLEMELIKFYGKISDRTGILCNMTDGGEGMIGWVHSSESKEKMSKSHMGKEVSDETRQKLSELRMGGKNHKAKLIIDTKTNITYNSIKEAAKEIDVSRKTLSAWLTGQNPNKSNMIYKIN